ncbi:transposase [Patescibacteria group bacterium]|nr:transposase [Patescibacteria group bacterium]MBU1867862.1 transposase [Patescibacteria group bacterium]
MPGRQESLDTGESYHVFNKTIDSKPVFINTQNATVFKETMGYYRSLKAFLSLSRYRGIEDKNFRKLYARRISYKKHFIVDILAYCIMPTHFHLLLKQKKDKGISKYMSDVINSFTRFHNLKSKRKGPLFLPQFRAKHIRTDDSLLNVSRYIHLNPLTGGVVNNINQLEKYQHSSYPEYDTDAKESLSDSNPIMKLFDYKTKAYRDYVINQLDYQSSLETMKHARGW